ncbi:MAG: hypothetical protein Q9217_004370 [Psora testacea]
MGQKVQSELDEYEQQRQANIAQRNKLLKDLALDARAAGLGPKPVSKPAAKSSTPRKKPAAKKVEVSGPRRTSSRLQGIVADSEVAKRKAEEEYAAVQETAKIKRQRNSADMKLGDVVVRGNGWDQDQNFLVDIMRRGANPYERTFGETEVKETTDKDLRSLREQMSALELYDGFPPSEIKITDERIYSLGFHPTTDKALVFAGDKLGNLGVFDASQKSASAVKSKTNGVKQEHAESEDEDEVKPAITSFHTHTRTISSFQFSPSEPSHLYTSSYDSSLRLLDLTKSTSVEIYGPEDATLDEPLSGVEIDPLNPHLLYFSRLDGHVGRLDTRANPRTADVYELSEKKIGGFSLHPGQPHFVATASLDRYLRIWDLRKLSGKVGRQLPALIGEHESRLSVSHAAFNSAGQVATASYDDTIKIHTFDGMGSYSPGQKIGVEGMEPSSIIRHNNQTGRWVTILRAQWQRHPPNSIQRFCIGNMNRFVDIYSASGAQLAQLGGDGITAVPAVAQFHPTEQWVAAGTASGKLCLWM